MREGYVYIIRAKGTDSYKVGFSNKPPTRLKTHQTSNHKDLEVLKTWKGTQADESYLHNILRAFATEEGGTEWFEIKVEDLLEALALTNAEVLAPPSSAEASEVAYELPLPGEACIVTRGYLQGKEGWYTEEVLVYPHEYAEGYSDLADYGKEYHAHGRYVASQVFIPELGDDFILPLNTLSCP